MIKDKITPEIKNKFREALEMTAKTGNEHGFLICKDENGNLQSGNLCVGDKCSVMPRGKCPHKEQGKFHTHPDVSAFGFLPRSIASLAVKGAARLYGLSITTPSHQDLVLGLLDKCDKTSEGTICVASEAQTNKVSCWTPNIKVPAKGAFKEGTVCDRALGELGEFEGPPGRWIKRLFDVENIDI